jgi:predicted GNAT family N-acyltransferase
MDVRQIEASATLPLRSAVLRPGRPLESCRFEGDDDATTLHLGAFVSGRLVGIATLLKRPMPGRPETEAWQLRGMAVDETCRQTGAGRTLVEACIGHVHMRHGRLLWCNARIAAEGFYRKCGFEQTGGTFEVAGVGPHVVMWISPRPDRRAA